jgi:hypothetical protein
MDLFAPTGLCSPAEKSENIEVVVSPDSQRLQLLEPFPPNNGILLGCVCL